MFFLHLFWKFYHLTACMRCVCKFLYCSKSFWFILLCRRLRIQRLTTTWSALDQKFVHGKYTSQKIASSLHSQILYIYFTRKVYKSQQALLVVEFVTFLIEKIRYDTIMFIAFRKCISKVKQDYCEQNKANLSIVTP